MNQAFMVKLEAVREECGFPLPVTSGYRCPKHNQSVSTTGEGGPHTTGRAVDIAVSGEQAFRLIQVAILHGMTGFGLRQSGTSRFVHLDDLTLDDGYPRPRFWTY